MCRFLVYQGNDEILLSKLILDPTHSILKQSFDSRLRLDTRRGQNNADGFGLGWYTDPKLGPGPCVFRSTTPAWNCTNLARLASKTASRLIFGHVRATTEGSLSEDNCHPFYHGTLMWMHNGGLGGWKYIKRRLSERLADRWYLGVQGGTDSEWAFALFLDTLERMGHDPSTVWESHGDSKSGSGNRNSNSNKNDSSSPSASSPKGFGPTVLRRAMLSTIRIINELTDQIPESVIRADNVDTRSLLNFAVTDGHSVICTRYISSSTDEAASLYYSSGTQWETRTAAADDGHYHMERRDKVADVVLVASEPLTFERENWVNVSTNSILTIHDQTIMVHPIVDEYYDADPAHLRSSAFVQTKGLVSNEKAAVVPAAFPPPVTSSPILSAESSPDVARPVRVATTHSIPRARPSLIAARCVNLPSHGSSSSICTVSTSSTARPGRSPSRSSATTMAPSPIPPSTTPHRHTQSQPLPPIPSSHSASPSTSSPSRPQSPTLPLSTSTPTPENQHQQQPRHVPSERNISRKRAALPNATNTATATTQEADNGNDGGVTESEPASPTQSDDDPPRTEFGNPKKISRFFPELTTVFP